MTTIEQLLNVDKEIRKNSGLHNNLINSETCNHYDLKEVRKKLSKLFSYFTSARYLYKFPIEENISITSNIESSGIKSSRPTSSKVEKAVEQCLDKQLLVSDIYDSIIVASQKLTDAEATYMIDTFLYRKSEESTAEDLKISKTYLQKIKKSCLIKIWVDLKEYCQEND